MHAYERSVNRMRHKPTIFTRILLSACIILISAGCCLYWPRTAELNHVCSTIREINHSGIRLVSERMPTGTHDPVANILRHLVREGPKGGGWLGFPNGAAQYEFQASTGLLECDLFYQDFNVYYIKIVSPASALTTARAIKDTLRKGYPGVWIRLGTSP